MSTKLICDGCGNETVYNPSALQGTDWLQEPMIGGTRVLCPGCRTTNEDYLIEKEIETLKKIYVARATERAEKEAEEKYTPEYVKQLRKERGEIIFPHFKQNTLNDFLLDKSKTREERPKDGILL